MRRPSLRRPLTLLLACAAAVLNALAPVLAYAAGQPLHELAGGRPGGGARAVLAAHAHHHGAEHQHATPHTLDHEKPAAPHCPYCLDFAAGAPLAPTLLAPAVVRPAAQARAMSAPTQLSARPSLRLASPRAPPSAG